MHTDLYGWSHPQPYPYRQRHSAIAEKVDITKVSMLASKCRAHMARWPRSGQLTHMMAGARTHPWKRHATTAAASDALSEASSTPAVTLPERGQQHAEASTSQAEGAGTQSQEEDLPTMQLNLPPAESSRIKQAEFIKSSTSLEQCPPPKWPEFAVIGRSNVGKSSLINMLTNRKALALVSKEPGKTRCINHFLINNNWYLVDLPGYGYAKLSKSSRKQFDSFSKEYFLGRKTLAMVLQLVDSSITPQAIDLDYSAWLAANGVPFTVVFTKFDKRKKGSPAKSSNILAYKKALLQERGFTVLPPSLVTSAAAGTGKLELLSYLSSLRVLFEMSREL